MKIDFRKDRVAILKYIRERGRNYPIYVDPGPGADDDPITQMTLGYQFDQAGWVALVFDTRKNAKLDGEWQSYIEENEHPALHWVDIYETLYVKEKPVAAVFHDGSKASLTSENDLAEVIGDFLRDLLVACRDDGMFDKLPCASDCRLSVEEHEGQYSWSSSSDAADDDETEIFLEVTDEVLARAAKMSKKKQLEFWLERLDRIASETKLYPGDHDKGWYDDDGNSEALAKLGATAVVPMLELALKYAGKPQFEGDRTPQKIKGECRELYRSSVMLNLVSHAEEIGHATPEIEALFLKIIAKAVKANAGRKMWGTLPCFAGRALSGLFSEYPWPELGSYNEIDPSPFVPPKRK